MSAEKAIRRVEYAGSVHDEAEVDAVLSVLRGGPTALRLGRKVLEMERLVAALFGKKRGVMCNSGSSALYLAVELLRLQPGDEIITSPVTFSTDIACMVRSGIVPVFVDVEYDSYQIDVEAIERNIGARTRALLIPNLIGNCPDWDRIRAIANAHNLKVIEDSCDCLGATLRGTPTGTRSDISVTSFAMSHIITAAATGGMVALDDPALVDRCLLLRRWGRRSEVKFYGSKKGDRSLFSTIDGMEYDDLFIFDEVGWNFEPSELSAAFGIVQIGKLPRFLAQRKRNAEVLYKTMAKYPDVFVPPRITAGVDTAWHMFPFMINPDSGVRRALFQQHMETHGVDTRMVWTGNATRQPAFKDTPYRVDPRGLPNADRVMEYGLILPCTHACSDDDMAYIGHQIDGFFKKG
jgi:CDP-6-deoxy-D-xylo-4-hexulose-3-dehydrase